jgi:hypothetical protein
MPVRRASPSWTRAAVAAAWLLSAGASTASALDVRVKDVRVPAGNVVATIELRNLIPDKLRHVLDEGGALHLRVQTELWESRPVWDRLVYPAIVQVLRFAKMRTSRQFTIANSAGGEASYAALPNELAIDVVIGKADRVTRDARYYVHVIATLGSLRERDVDDVGDAVFGRPNEVNGLGAFGRMLFRKMIEISDYLESETAEARSRTARLAFP